MSKPNQRIHRLRKGEIRAFQDLVYGEYRSNGRMFPWRKTRDPYRILVSEIMLQQTQTGRVVQKYEAFLKVFPNVEMLAMAQVRDVFNLWQGLGYNRRAKMLRDAARVVVEEHRGAFPKSPEALEALPGIGPYTARAVCAFSFNQPVVMIETNIRTVYMHHFFKGTRRKISDREILQYIRVTLDTKNPRKWYAALMDYGAQLKQAGYRLNDRSVHYAKQKPFKGSERELRGKILRALAASHKQERVLIEKMKDARAEAQIQALIRDGLIARRGKTLMLAH